MKQIIRFYASGIFVIGTDFSVYYALHQILPYSVSKAVSYICGSIAAYLFNKYWTFEQLKPSSLEIVRFIAANFLMFVVNVSTNQSVINLWPGHIFQALLIATALTAVLAFVLFKWWVFRR